MFTVEGDARFVVGGIERGVLEREGASVGLKDKRDAGEESYVSTSCLNNTRNTWCGIREKCQWVRLDA